MKLISDFFFFSETKPEKLPAPRVTELAGPKLKLEAREHHFTGLDLEIDEELEKAKKVSKKYFFWKMFECYNLKKINFRPALDSSAQFTTSTPSIASR